MNSPDGRDTTANVLLFIAGIATTSTAWRRVLTGQFSRLGTLLDPLVDRLLIIAVSVVIIHFDLLPDVPDAAGAVSRAADDAAFDTGPRCAGFRSA